MKRIVPIITLHLLLIPILAADEPKLRTGNENASRLHADGKGWRLDKAKISNPKLPRVLLIGDSILNGYLKQVVKDLDGKAYVDAWVNPYHQSEHVNKLLAEVVAHGPYDVVHFNMGLHGWPEGRIMPGRFEPLTKAYVEVLKAELPNAKFIWASSTPVTMKDNPTELEPKINPIIVKHNRMAAKVMAEMKVHVNDFYSLLVDKNELARGDRFHWTEPAYKILADQATKSILQMLSLATKREQCPLKLLDGGTTERDATTNRFPKKHRLGGKRWRNWPLVRHFVVSCLLDVKKAEIACGYASLGWS